ncbi:MAG TPA: N-acyl homoserine lactonase family protein [Anaerolineales bacterium]|nr:N-acyl homoserine lactonase family protein [Anaerolineales bacterium]
MNIHAIQTGTVRIKKNQVVGKGPRALRLVNVLLGRDWVEPVPIYAWVIEHNEGVIVVDTGDTSRTSEPGYFPRWHPYYNLAVRFDIKPEQEVGVQLKRIGIGRKDVKKVVLTHMHTDHAGGLHHFPESQIYVNMPEYKRYLGLSGQINGYLPQRAPAWFSPNAIIFDDKGPGPFQKAWNITGRGDLKVVTTHGHTPAHVSVIASSEDVHYFLAGDTSYSEENLLKRIPDGVSPNPDITVDTMQNILKFASLHPTVYLPTHDPDSEKRLKNKTTLAIH